jgi:hypothetical protein
MAHRERTVQPSAAASLSPEAAAAVADLDRLAGSRSELTGAARLLARLIAAAFPKNPAPIAAVLDFGSDREATLQKLRSEVQQGRPVLHCLPPTLDSAEIHQRGVALCRVLASENPQAEPLARAIEQGRFSLTTWIRAHVTGSPQPDPLEFDTALLDSLARLAALPSLAPASGQLLELGVLAGGPRIACPCCGSTALLAEARGLEQHRALRCGWCAAAWSMPRLACPDCGANRLGDLLTYYVDGESERYRLLGCRQCDLRLRVVSTLASLSPSGLLVAELASLHLDFLPLEDDLRVGPTEPR